MSRFVLVIDLGNKEMRDPAQVADALIRAGHLVRRDGRIKSRGIMDANGNTVGQWSADWPPAERDGGV